MKKRRFRPILGLPRLLKLDYVIPSVSLLDFRALALVIIIPVLHLQVLHVDPRVGINGTRDEGVASDDGILSDDGLTAEDGCSGIDGHVVADGRMTLFPGELLAAPGGERSDGNALIDLYVLTDDGGLTDYDAGSVVDKEVLVDGRSRMNVDSGLGLGKLRHQSGQHGYLQQV